MGEREGEGERERKEEREREEKGERQEGERERKGDHEYAQSVMHMHNLQFSLFISSFHFLANFAQDLGA